MYSTHKYTYTKPVGGWELGGSYPLVAAAAVCLPRSHSLTHSQLPAPSSELSSYPEMTLCYSKL